MTKFSIKNTTKIIFFIVFVVFFLFSKVQALESESASANKSYSYSSIIFDFQVNKDSTVDVIEKETFQFNGEYHLGWRSLKLNKLDNISDILIYDGDTDLPLKYVSRRLDKTDPNSWGSYTVFTENNSKNVEWYYDAKDVTRTWVLRYKLHGAIGFYKDHDELYYNLLTDFTVPIGYVEANVNIPINTSLNSPVSFYRSYTEYPYNFNQIDERNYFFRAENIQIGESLTIAPGWQKEIVKKKAYWSYYILSHWGIFSAIFLVLISIIGSLVYWYIKEKKPIKDATVIAQYEPPENLPPAMAEILIKENITEKTWPATVIDLACKGYLKIEEEKQTTFEKLMNSNSLARKVISVLIIIVSLWYLYDFYYMPKSPILFLFIIPVGVGVFLSINKISFDNKNYILHKIDKDTKDLEMYEKEYLDFLFKGKNVFSTKEEIKKGKTEIFYGQERYKELVKIQKNLFEELNMNTKAYEMKPRYINWYNLINLLLKIISFGLVFLLIFVHNIKQNTFLGIGILISLMIIILTIFNPRLNNKGVKMKVEWLGFKLYLNTAERYRLQNLTPDLFEKYLSYAIIFGIEKKWAKAFDGLNIENPSWYISSNTSGAVLGGGVVTSGFSPSSFTASFSSSFTSSFGGTSGGGGGGAGGARHEGQQADQAGDGAGEDRAGRRLLHQAQALSERRLLFRHRLQGAGHPRQHVHRDLRAGTHRGLDRAVEGADCRLRAEDRTSASAVYGCQAPRFCGDVETQVTETQAGTGRRFRCPPVESHRC